MSTIQPTYDELVSAALSSTMSLLSNASEQELKDLLNDETKLDSLVNDVTQLKSLDVEREMLLAQNKSLAEWNMSQQPKLAAGKEQLQRVYEETEMAQNDVNNLKSRLDQMSTTRSLDTTLALLQAAAQEAEDISEKTAEQFVRGVTTVDEFVGKFTTERQLAHDRKVRAEKLAETLRQQQYNNLAARPATGQIPPYSSGAPRRAAPVVPTSNYWAQPVPGAQSGSTAYPQLPGFR